MTPAITLHNGDALPMLGLGFWKVDKPRAASLVHEAITVGYRHLDCACDYGNEAEVGDGLRAALDARLCSREELWVTSKLWNTYHGKEYVRPALERTLRDLKLDYLDLYLVHFPIAQRFVPFERRYPPGWFFDPHAPQPRMEFERVSLTETWEAMAALVTAGLVRNIGVCNMNTALLRDLLTTATVRPAVLQIELHPYLTQPKLLRFCAEHRIAVTGFSPLGAPSYVPLGMATPEESVLEETVVQSAATRHGRTPAQVVLRWAIQRGTAVVPKTSQSDRLRENLNVFSFELTSDEMSALTALNRNRRFNDPGDFCEAAFNTFCPIYE